MKDERVIEKALRVLPAETRLTVYRWPRVFFWGDENEDFLKVMNSFFDLDENAVMQTPCGRYTHDLICCRRLFNILIVATKSAGGVNIFSALRTTDLGEMNTTRCIIQ